VISDKKAILTISGALYFDAEVFTAQDHYGKFHNNYYYETTLYPAYVEWYDLFKT
jgi:hypothetical protein